MEVDTVHNVEFSFSSEAADRMVKKFEDDFEGARKRFMSGFFADRDSEILKWILEKPGGSEYGDFDAVLMPDVGHFLMLEKPVEFNRHLRIMIDQLRKN